MVEKRIKDATKILNLLRSMSDYKPHFEIIGNYRLIDDGIQPEATIMLRANGKEMHEAETGVGPVDALAKVLKKSLKTLFPEIDQIKLIDFGARILDSSSGTATGVQVEILFSNGKDAWRVKEFSENICRAAFLALVDGFEYGIYISRPPTPQPSPSRGEGKGGGEGGFMDRKRLEEAIKEKAKEGKIPCAMCFKVAEDFGISKREIGQILNEINIRISQCQLGCFE